MLITAYMQLKHNYDKNYTLHNKDYPIISYESDKNLVTFINENKEFDTIPMNKITITKFTSLPDIVNSINKLIGVYNGRVESNNTFTDGPPERESINTVEPTRRHKKENNT